MSRRKRGMMSEELKTELAKELGFYETVERECWKYGEKSDPAC